MSERLTKKNQTKACWCAGELVAFSESYVVCKTCQTLVLRTPQNINDIEFFNHDIVYPVNQYIHWLSILLKYCPSSANVWNFNDVKSDFFALMQSIGYSLIQPQNKQLVEVITLTHILENIICPESIIQRCLESLKPEGVLLIQTSNYMEHQRIFASKTKTPIYQFNIASIQLLLKKFGFEYVIFDDLSIDKSDLFLVASRVPLTPCNHRVIEKSLNRTLEGKMALALMEQEKKYHQIDKERCAYLAKTDALVQKLDNSEKDRALRFEQIQTLTQRIQELEKHSALRLEQIEALTKGVEKLETDCSARLKQVDTLTDLLKNTEADRLARGTQIETLTTLLKASDADRSARLTQIEKIAHHLSVSENQRISGLAKIAELEQALKLSLAELETIRYNADKEVAELTRLLNELENKEKRGLQGTRWRTLS